MNDHDFELAANPNINPHQHSFFSVFLSIFHLTHHTHFLWLSNSFFFSYGTGQQEHLLTYRRSIIQPTCFSTGLLSVFFPAWIKHCLYYKMAESSSIGDWTQKNNMYISDPLLPSVVLSVAFISHLISTLLHT